MATRSQRLRSGTDRSGGRDRTAVIAPLVPDGRGNLPCGCPGRGRRRGGNDRGCHRARHRDRCGCDVRGGPDPRPAADTPGACGVGHDPCAAVEAEAPAGRRSAGRPAQSETHRSDHRSGAPRRGRGQLARGLPPVVHRLARRCGRWAGHRRPGGRFGDLHQGRVACRSGGATRFRRGRRGQQRMATGSWHRERFRRSDDRPRRCQRHRGRGTRVRGGYPGRNRAGLGLDLGVVGRTQRPRGR